MLALKFTAEAAESDDPEDPEFEEPDPELEELDPELLEPEFPPFWEKLVVSVDDPELLPLFPELSELLALALALALEDEAAAACWVRTEV